MPKLANLPKENLSKLERADINYAVGWSEGKERFRGKIDNMKCSFYANPLKDDLEYEYNGQKVNYHNIWPKEDIPEFEDSYKSLGKIMYNVGIQMAKFLGIYFKKINIQKTKYHPIKKENFTKP